MKGIFYILLIVFSVATNKILIASEIDTLAQRALLDSLDKEAENYDEENDYANYETCVFRQLEICSTIGDTARSAQYMLNIARCFANTMRLAESLSYLNKSLSICQKTGDSTLSGAIYALLGSIYATSGICDMALDYLNKYLEIAKSQNDEQAVLDAEFTIAVTKGQLYELKNDTLSLLEAIKTCERIYPQIANGDDVNLFFNFCSQVPKMYINAREFSDEKRAKYFLEKADEIYCTCLPLTKKNPVLAIYMFPTKIELFCAKKNFQGAKHALDSFDRDGEVQNCVFVDAACTYYKAVEDYPNYLKYSEENRKITHITFSSEMCVKYERNQSQARYEEQVAEYEKNAKHRELMFKQETERTELQNHWMLIIIVIVMIIAVIKVIQLFTTSRVNKTLKKTNKDIQFRNDMLKQLQNQILEQTDKIKAQNGVIEEQKDNLKNINEHLVGSIRYAQRIQRAAVPSKEMMDDIFPENFVYWNPRDIVSGDFYWAAKDGSRKFLITADCTGHGVPGALLSMLGISIISDAFASITPQTNAGEILDLVKSKFLESWEKSSTGTIEDGIDMALVVVDTQNNTLQYAGAKRPLVMVRQNEAVIIKPDKMCIGHNIKKLEKNFSNYVVDTMPGDMFYAFSDGIPDQFGGQDGKSKFSQSVLVDLLSNIADLPVEVQQSAVKANVVNWVEYNNVKTKQLDDQLLIGIRI